MVNDSLLPLDIGANIIYNYDKAMFKVGKIRRDLEGSLICEAKVHNYNINHRFLVQIPPHNNSFIGLSFPCFVLNSDGFDHQKKTISVKSELVSKKIK